MNCVHICWPKQCPPYQMAGEEIGLQPRSTVTLRHARQDFDTISSEGFFVSIFRVLGKTSVIRVGFFKRTSKLWPRLVALKVLHNLSLNYSQIVLVFIMSIITANICIGLLLPYIHFDTVIKHVLHSFDFLLCSFTIRMQKDLR